EQMVNRGYLNEAEATEARETHINIVERGNTFLEQAPHFTEYARRYLVEKYGEDPVLNDGLRVRTTCDLDLQKTAQEAVVKQALEVDHRMGFRREGIETLKGDAAIAKRREEHDLAMRKAWVKERDPARRIPLPEKTLLEPEQVADAVIIEVTAKWARAGIGSHEAVIPLAWSEWVFQPNPRRSWRHRKQTDLTEKVDTDKDGKKDSQILQVGDVVLVKVKALSTRDEEVAKVFRKTPGELKSYVAARLWQEPEIEAAMMSFDLTNGAVRAMVGGADFTTSQFNRATQGRRQVGSTFKPIVYGAAIDSRKITTASLVPDAPLAFATNDDFIWKPANFGADYEGDLTLRQALAASKNTCTVRVLETMDPGMNDDVVYKFARALGIGGPPLHTLPEGYVTKPENDLLCPWTREDKDSTICMDRFPPKDPNMSNTRHRMQLKPDDVYMCRTCDMSIGLGTASLTMLELMRAYSAFATEGYLIEPYFIEGVYDRDGKVLESHETQKFEQVIDPRVASITRWLLENVVSAGTGYQAKKELKFKGLGGKTGTTDDYKDTWFIGFSPEVITAAWVGFDQPRSMGYSSTGGRTALPIWIDYMREAALPEKDKAFRMHREVEWAQIDEATGRRVSSGGRRYPFLDGTLPESSGIAAGQVSLQDLTTEL
ncbi:MAG: hypothetical protein HN348_01800, partial [Proteobacteria bacterium]|nr:hypothetical protein [Pseudomonadota bacterium]